MSSVGTVSSGSLSALVHEIEGDAVGNQFGTNPITASGSSGSAAIPVGRYGRWLNRMRTRVIPRLFAEANTDLEQIQLILNLRVKDGRNSLSYTNSTAIQTIDAVVTGPSAEMLERGFLSASDYEVMVAANDITVGISEKHRVKFDNAVFSIVDIRPIPRRPYAVAYKFGIKRAAP